MKVTDYVIDSGAIRAVLKRLATEAGYNLVDGSFDEGVTVTSSTDAVWDIPTSTY